MIDFSKIPVGWYLAGFWQNPENWMWTCELQWIRGGGRLQSVSQRTAIDAFNAACALARVAKVSGSYSPDILWDPAPRQELAP